MPPTRHPCDPGVLRFLTAGSVDDGKSTLIGRLLYDTRSVLADQLAAVARSSARRGTALDLSLLTDGLAAEREQGITIDVAYRYFATAARKFIVADAPGHVQYTRNMITAASTAQLAVLLVDARNGVVEQTRRHAALVRLLGLPHVVVAVNKMDLVGYGPGAFDAVVAEFRVLAQRIGLTEARFVPIAAGPGDMVVERGEHLDWYTGPTLLQILESIDIPHAAPRGGLRFPVQYVSLPAGGRARGYLGRVEAGRVAAGDPVVVLPGGRSTRVRAIHTFDGEIAAAGVGASVRLELADEIDVSRGDLLVHPDGSPTLARTLVADLAWLGHAPLDARRTYALHHSTREIRARITGVHDRFEVATQARRRAGTLAMNDIGRVSIALAQPLGVDRYDDNRATGSFILVDEASHDTVAAGMIR